MKNSYKNIQTKEILNKEVIDSLDDNALLKYKPELFEEWDFDKNSNLNIYEITRGSGRRVWWICKECNHNFNLKIDNRVQYTYCEKCNSLALKRPDIASQWHPTKNGKRTPHDVTFGSGQKVWWKCEYGHEWDATVSNRTNIGRGCPYCSNRLVWRGFNDLWTTHPEISNLLLNPEDGYKYSYGSKTKLNWKCPNCHTIIKNKHSTTVIDNYGLGCKGCKDGISYGEKFIYQIIKSSNLLFYHDIIFDWSDNKEYDFYIPESNIIIEVHGGQHYKEAEGKWADNNSLIEIQENDRYKEQLAKENGIEHYIIIDARKKNLEWLKKSISSSKLSHYILDIDFEHAHKFAQKSFMILSIALWNCNHSIIEISQELVLSTVTVRNYLKRGTKLGLCLYNAKEEASKNGRKQGGQIRRGVVQLTLNGEFIKEWNSMRAVKMELGIDSNGISSVCKGKRKTSGKFKWMFKEDYDNMIKNK